MKMPKTIRVSDYVHSKIKTLAAVDKENIEDYAERIFIRHIAGRRKYLNQKARE